MTKTAKKTAKKAKKNGAVKLAKGVREGSARSVILKTMGTKPATKEKLASALKAAKIKASSLTGALAHLVKNKMIKRTEDGSVVRVA